MATIPEGELQFEIGEIKPQKWEYLATPLYTTDSRYGLNDFGDKGWELVTILIDKDGVFRAYFKRPIWSE